MACKAWQWCTAAVLVCAAAVAHADSLPAPDVEAERPAGELNFLWQDVTHNLPETDVLAIAADPAQPRQAFIGTAHALYRTRDGGRTWEERFTLRDTGTTVHAMLVTAEPPHRVYVGTDQGLWISTDDGTHWRRGGIRGPACLALLQDPAQPARLWAGTATGLYQSADGGRTWRVVGGELARQRVAALGRDPSDPAALYAATDTSLMMTADQGRTWQQSLLTHATGEEPEPAAVETGEEYDAQHAPSSAVRVIAFDPTRPHEVVAIVRDGALISRDRGRSWDALPTTGLPHTTIHSAVITHASAPRLYVATDRGVWTFDRPGGRWHELYRGMTAHRVRQLAVQPQDGSVWAATDRGVFHGAALPGSDDTRVSPLKVWTLFQHEPAVDEIQRWAIRYSETDPAKIARWRHQAAMKALLPTVSFSVARNNTVNDHYDEGTFPKFQKIPMRDLDRNLGVSMSWNLSELIWNEDQTSIDTRSKLTTELRDQIVAEVTQLYFERRRLQMEMAFHPADASQHALEQALRVQELTAQIDALTGGRFSHALEGGQ